MRTVWQGLTYRACTAGLSFAMANAVSEAKSAAKIVSKFTNEESAVAKELRMLLEQGHFDS